MIRRTAVFGTVIAAALILGGATPGDRALESLALGNAYLVLEITDQGAPRPEPYRVKVLSGRDGRLLAKIFWPPGNRGATVLWTPEYASAYFPRADLKITGDRGGRLFGLDPLLLKTLIDPASAFRGARRTETPASCEAGPCRVLQAAGRGLPGCEKLSLRLLDDGTPLRMACLAESGKEAWGLRFSDPVVVRGAPRPRAVEYEVGGRPRARLRVIFFEADPPVPADMFTREGLARW